jgi:hypothetical protein
MKKIVNDPFELVDGWTIGNVFSSAFVVQV